MPPVIDGGRHELPHDGPRHADARADARGLAVDNRRNQVGRPGDFPPRVAVSKEWCPIRKLPDYLQNPIRALGRQIFDKYTATPLEDINVVSNFTNGLDHVEDMMRWIAANGTQVMNDELLFEGGPP
jgi:hypothetical protein